MKKMDLSEWSDWIDGQDVMEKLHITQRTLQRWRTNRLIPFSQLRGRLYYRKSDIIRLLKKGFNGK
jgi:DNA-binding transcriptional MerR regulator